MKRYLSFFWGSVAAASIALFAALSAKAQVPSLFGPPNTDLGVIITNTARPIGTVTSNQQTNQQQKGLVCMFVGTASSGSPSTTFSIQGYDAATNTYYNMATSGAITDTTPTILMVSPGIQTSSLPTGWTAFNSHVPLKWRISQTVGGTAGSTVTGKLGCNLLN